MIEYDTKEKGKTSSTLEIMNHWQDFAKFIHNILITALNLFFIF